MKRTYKIWSAYLFKQRMPILFCFPILTLIWIVLPTQSYAMKAETVIKETHSTTRGISTVGLVQNGDRILSSDRKWANHIQSSFIVLKDTTIADTAYMLGWYKQNGKDASKKLDSLVLRTVIHGEIADHKFDLGQDIDMDLDELKISVVQLVGLPCFMLLTRYQIRIWPLGEGIRLLTLEPGKDVEYRGDAISGLISALVPWDNGKYLMGSAVSYGVFCFALRDLIEPVELPRTSSKFSDKGQPYFFLDKGTTANMATGIIARSDLSSSNRLIHGSYSKLLAPEFLFKDLVFASTNRPTSGPLSKDAFLKMVDPLKSQMRFIKIPVSNSSSGPDTVNIIDLVEGQLLKGAAAKAYLLQQGAEL